MKPVQLISLATSVVALGAAVAQAELKAGQQYQGGSRVQASGLGISFILPQGWLGAYKQEGEQAVVVLGSNTVEGLGLVIFMKNQTPAQVMQSLNDTQDLGDGVVLELAGAPHTQGSRVTARYLNHQYVGRALALLGSKNHVIYFYAGPQKNEQLYGQLLEALAGSTRFQAPAPKPATPAPAPTGLAKQWTQFLSGMMLRYLSSYNSGGGGGGMSTDKTLHFCSDGSFAFLNNSLTTMNVDGATASSGGNNRYLGRWRIESAGQAEATLLLSYEGGQVERVRLNYDGQKTFLNGVRWFRVESDACR